MKATVGDLKNEATGNSDCTVWYGLWYSSLAQKRHDLDTARLADTGNIIDTGTVNWDKQSPTRKPPYSSPPHTFVAENMLYSHVLNTNSAADAAGNAGAAHSHATHAEEAVTGASTSRRMGKRLAKRGRPTNCTAPAARLMAA